MKGLMYLLAAQAFSAVLAAPTPIAATNVQVARSPEKLGEDILLSLVGAYSDEVEGSDVAKRSQLAEDNIILIVLAYDDEAQNATDAGHSVVKRAPLPEKLGEDILLSLVGAYSDEVEGSDALVQRSELADNNIIFIVLAYDNETDSTDVSRRNAKRAPKPEKLGEDILLSLVGAYSDEVEGSDAMAKRSEMAENNIILIVLAYDDEAEAADASKLKAKRAPAPEKLGEDILLSLVGAYSDEVEGSDVATKTKRDGEAMDVVFFIVSSDGSKGAYADDVKAAEANPGAVLGY